MGKGKLEKEMHGVAQYLCNFRNFDIKFFGDQEQRLEIEQRIDHILGSLSDVLKSLPLMSMDKKASPELEERVKEIKAAALSIGKKK